ncbi:MAG: hypothetical protein K6B74_06010 [Ruminococcus sp.]|nr:hypothetical protein [Ruminococcus sp.]
MLNHRKYDETDGSVFVKEIFFYDSIGEKYDTEIMLKDGSVIHKDLYVSPEYNLAFFTGRGFTPSITRKKHPPTALRVPMRKQNLTV